MSSRRHQQARWAIDTKAVQHFQSGHVNPVEGCPLCEKRAAARRRVLSRWDKT